MHSAIVELLSQSLFWALVAFVGSALTICFAGAQLERHAAAIVKKLSLSAIVAGVLLAVSTSLPEVATAMSATLAGNISLATHSLLGGVVFQTAVLFIADVAFRRGALTAFAANYILLLQGVALIAMLAIILVAIAVETAPQFRFPIFGVSIWLWLLLLISFGGMRAFTIYRKHPAWQPGGQVPSTQKKDEETAPDEEQSLKQQTTSVLWVKFVSLSAVILAAGWLCATSADMISRHTGLAASFVGFTFVSIATSLPEISTVLSSIRRGSVGAAISNIFGSNIFDISLLVLVALCGGGGLLFADHLVSSMVAAATGILLTCIYLWGLLERDDRSVFKVGIESFIVLFTAVLANWLIFRIG